MNSLIVQDFTKLTFSFHPAGNGYPTLLTAGEGGEGKEWDPTLVTLVTLVTLLPLEVGSLTVFYSHGHWPRDSFYKNIPSHSSKYTGRKLLG